jgi:hypothetical protein
MVVASTHQGAEVAEGQAGGQENVVALTPQGAAQAEESAGGQDKVAASTPHGAAQAGGQENVAASTPQGSAQAEGQADGRVGDEVPNANGVADGVHVGAEGGKCRTPPPAPVDESSVVAATFGDHVGAEGGKSRTPSPPTDDESSVVAATVGDHVAAESGNSRTPPPPDEDDRSMVAAPLTGAELKKLWKEAAAKEKAEKKRLKETSDVKLKRLRKARAELKDAIQAVRKKPRLHPKDQDNMPREPDEADSSCSELSSNDEGAQTGKSVRKRLTQLEKWANGNKAMRERKQVYVQQALVDTWAEAHEKLCHVGFAIVNNFTALLGSNHRPDMEQRDYIRHAAEADKQIVFEAVYLDDQSSSVKPHYDKDNVDARRQLKDSSKKVYLDYKAKYAPQQADIIAGMFEGGIAGNSANWKLNWNTLIGGTNYQHPHTDTGRVGTYNNLDVFPFVALHGFGIDPFSLWLLPEPFELRYGFLHTFEAHQMVLMRGDFVHAGVPSPIPRGHMEFFPLHGAGWTRRPAYWARKNYQQVAFPWQHPTFPFGYPDVGSANENGLQLMTYPVDVTRNLQHPLKNEEMTDAQKQKKKMKKRMTAQLESY